MIAIGKVDIGRKRQKNEDALFVSNTNIGILPNLYIVADGMGGHQAGGVASRMAIDAFCEYLLSHETATVKTGEDVLRLMKMALMHANYTIYELASTKEQYAGMGTTFTATTVIEDALYSVHVGDTRIYLMNKDTIIQATTDHSLVQEMLSQGYISESDMQEHPQRHIITRAVGTYDKVKIDTQMHDLTGMDYIMLCSDGLTSMIAEQTIHTIVYNHQDDFSKIPHVLIEEANKQGGLDNIAVIIGKKYEVSR